MSPDLQFAAERKPGVGDKLAVWLPRLALALLFLNIGWGKFAESGMWVHIFDRIGFGTWFRYLAGAMQVGGALLLLVPRAVVVGAALIACTLVGAVIAQIAVFHSISAIVPGVLLIPVLFVGVRGMFGD